MKIPIGYVLSISILSTCSFFVLGTRNRVVIYNASNENITACVENRLMAPMDKQSITSDGGARNYFGTLPFIFDPQHPILITVQSSSIGAYAYALTFDQKDHVIDLRMADIDNGKITKFIMDSIPFDHSVSRIILEFGKNLELGFKKVEKNWDIGPKTAEKFKLLSQEQTKKQKSLLKKHVMKGLKQPSHDVL